MSGFSGNGGGMPASERDHARGDGRDRNVGEPHGMRPTPPRLSGWGRRVALAVAVAVVVIAALCLTCVTVVVPYV
jgi:hypothetical protein